MDNVFFIKNEVLIRERKKNHWERKKKHTPFGYYYYDTSIFVSNLLMIEDDEYC